MLAWIRRVMLISDMLRYADFELCHVMLTWVMSCYFDMRYVVFAQGIY
jgi:hypothetical protein